MTVVKRCATLEDAYMIKNLLESGGVGADILDEATASTAPYLLISSGIRVTVADEDADAAREILGLPAEPEAPVRTSGGIPWLAVLIAGIALVTLISYARQDRHPADPQKIDEDRNGDGKSDLRTTYDDSNRPVLTLVDDNFDGRWDTRVEYENGIESKATSDLDHDGTFDSDIRYNQGVPSTELVTPGGEGNPLFRKVFKNGVLESRWEDADRDGAWDQRIDFDAMGRELGKTSLK
ncbi:MAG: hypothetical protein CFE26_01360 [Verrucomicrobiales bacterium VVV1]|nr:MAG: hypothetical protein CFE26_01360 [Verrucomicrobiales bacterium VVV1]